MMRSYGTVLVYRNLNPPLGRRAWPEANRDAAFIHDLIAKLIAQGMPT